MNLINSDRFASVNIRADKDEAQDYRVPVRIQVEPSAPKRLRPGIGYSTDFGPRVSLRYQDVNTFGRGHEFNADMNIAERRQAISSYYSLPGRGHIDNRTNLKLGFQRELLKPYDSLLWTTRRGTGAQFRVWNRRLRLPPIPGGTISPNPDRREVPPSSCPASVFPSGGSMT